MTQEGEHTKWEYDTGKYTKFLDSYIFGRRSTTPRSTAAGGRGGGGGGALGSIASTMGRQKPVITTSLAAIEHTSTPRVRASRI
eukprot:SAG31_NODE_4926_length_2859_cov_110.767029_2_plen_84_part_00